jgi:hypothetical protein
MGELPVEERGTSVLSPAEREAILASASQCRPPIANEIEMKIYRAGWLACREWAEEQGAAFAAGQKMEWDGMRQRVADAEERERVLREALEQLPEELEWMADLEDSGLGACDVETCAKRLLAIVRAALASPTPQEVTDEFEAMIEERKADGRRPTPQETP